MPGCNPTAAGGLLRDERGVMTVLGVVFTVLLVGFGALVVDFGRLYNLHSQLQAYVDHVALAAAAELDGAGDAITRANRAALGDGQGGPLVTDTQSFAVGPAELSIQAPEYFGCLPDDDAADHEAELQACATNDPFAARFVRVRAVPRTEDYLVWPIVQVLGLESAAGATITTEAIAGFIREVCNQPPLMFCNPYEMQDGAPGGPFTPIIGQQILLKTGGSGASWVPGDFGLLDVASEAGAGVCTGGLSGTNRIRCVMGLINPNGRCLSGKANIRPGEAVSVHDGLNVRFDIWDPPLNSQRTNSAFRPARNVTKGLVPQNANQCSQNRHNPSPNTVPLPRDGCFASDTCSGGGRFGNGVTQAQLQAYWAASNPGRAFPAGAATRFDLYRAEIDGGAIPRAAGGRGTPMCAPSSYDPSPYARAADRRVMTVAVVNCVEHNVRGNTDNVPVIAFGQMFMTEPVTPAPGHSLYLEVLGVAEPGDESGILHDFPVLYR